MIPISEATGFSNVKSIWTD